jgi:hypothetical protein
MSMVWLVKGTNRPPLAVLYAFYRQRVSLVLKRVKVVFILRCVIIANEGFSRLVMLSVFSSLSFSDMLLATGGGCGT